MRGSGGHTAHPRIRAVTRSGGLILLCALTAGCEYAVSDVATRIRYALRDEGSALQRSGKDAVTLALRPDHWPDGCPGDGGYRLVLSPYRGGKQVATGDIVVHCRGGGAYYTGLGSEQLYVVREMSVEKAKEDDLRITLRRTQAGIEIVGLE